MILGFVTPETSSLPKLVTNVDTIPNKIGGRPIWLNPRPPKEIRCPNCSEIIPLLIQLYCPEDYPENAFHRVIYVFSCKKNACVSNNNGIVVLRCQLRLVNPFYDKNGLLNKGYSVSENSFLENGKPLFSYCQICGVNGDKTCGNCHFTKYCSKQHQQLDWNHGRHKEFCNQTRITPTIIEEWLSYFQFPEMEIYSEEEPDKPIEIDEMDTNELMKPEEGDTELLEEDETESEVDKRFLKFQKRIQLAPKQIMRYAREIDGLDEEPLWVSDKDKPELIPDCPCGSKRTFEFQLTSQLLSYLKLDNKNKDTLDWGTLIVYSCSSHCELANGQYALEYGWVQKFTSDGIGSSILNKHAVEK